MRCNTCKHESARIKVDSHGRESCPNCSSFSEAGGVSTSGALTRNAFRVRRQRDSNEGDFVQPHSYDKASKRVTVNPEFVKKYPDQAATYFNGEEMTKAGYSKLPAHAEKVERAKAAERAAVDREVEFTGDTDKGIGRVLS